MGKKSLYGLMILFIVGCVKPFEAPEIKDYDSFLVVEGNINTTLGSETRIILSRTRKLTDTVKNYPEPYARVAVESETGGSYLLQDNLDGTYTGALNLNNSGKYRLNIMTTNGKQYLSEFVAVKQAPAIDSLTWDLTDKVGIYLYTHDPQNNTWYYRWEFLETWEYRSFFDSNIGFRDNQLYFLDSSELKTICFTSSASTEILTGTSIRLSNDVIEKAPITVIASGTDKISWRYSILVRQFALTPEAFDYWELLKKITQEQGSLFDVQPAQLRGNFHSVNDPNEPVIGFLSASTVAEKRIFIKRGELAVWHTPDESGSCPVLIIPSQQAYIFLNADTTLSPAYYITGGGPPIALAKKTCTDCRKKGGTTARPPYW